MPSKECFQTGAQALSCTLSVARCQMVFNAFSIKGYLAKTWGLGPPRSDGVLLPVTTLEPPKPLASEVEAKAWLDGVVSVDAQLSGITLASPGAAGAGGGGGGGAVINSEEFQAD